MGLEVVRLVDRPELADAMWDAGDRAWPDFMQHDPVGDLYYGRLTRDLGHLALLALDGDEVVARAHAIPVAFEDGLPDRGWDAAIENGVALFDRGGTPTAASALEIGIVPERRGRGLSAVMLGHLRDLVVDLGLHDLYAPVRPSQKADVPHEDIHAYARATRDDGLPVDAWLRVHVRAGATIERVAPASMRIEADLATWRGWTGLPLEVDGPVVVPGALVPVRVDLAADRAVYVEPNVWVHHVVR